MAHRRGRLPDSGPYSLVLLSFAIFSFVAWQLRDTHRTLRLAWFAGVVMIFSTMRLFVDQARESGRMFALPDGVLLLAFLTLISCTAFQVLLYAVTDSPKTE